MACVADCTVTTPICVGALSVGLLSAAMGQVAYKLWFQRRGSFLLAAALGLFVLGQVGFFVALTGLALGLVYMSTALSQIVVLALSSGVVGERLTRDHAVGVGLIVLGILLYAS